MAKINLQQVGIQVRDAIVTILQELRDNDYYSVRFTAGGKTIKINGSYSDELDEINIRIRWRN